MARRLLLLSNEQRLAQLREAGILPETFLVEECDATDIVGPCIVHRDPTLIIPWATADDAPPPDLEGREMLFARLLRSVICHLVVLEDDRGPASDDLPAGDLAYRGQDVDRLVAWYERFREDAAKHLGYRNEDYRHILILVCADGLSPAHVEKLKPLLEPKKDERVVDQCFLMMRRLDWERSDVCHARYVWPAAVSYLLFRLAAEKKIDCPPQTTFAWRGFELTAVDQQTLTAAYETALSRAADAIAGRIEPLTIDVNGFAPSAAELEKTNLPDRIRDPSLGAMAWQQWHADRKLDSACDPDTINRIIRKAAGDYREQFARVVLSEEPASIEAAAGVWTEVHRHPGVVRQAVSAPWLVNEPDMEGHLTRMHGHWLKLQQLQGEFEQRVENGRGCAEALTDAQSSFISMTPRFIMASAVTLLIGWVAFLIFGEVFGSQLIAATITAAGLSGAALAAWVPWFVENQTGKRAVEKFDEQVLHPIHEAICDRHFHCQETVSDAFHFGRDLRTRSVMRRLQLLLLRLKSMLDHELDTHWLPPVVEQERNDAWALSPRAARCHEQLDNFLDDSRFMHRRMILNVEDDESLQRIDALTTRFVERWVTFCEDTDTARSGHLPARTLVPMLRRFCSELRSTLLIRLQRQVEQSLRDHPDYAEDWVRRIEDALLHQHMYHLSCSLDAGSVPREPHSLLLIPPQLGESSRWRTECDLVVRHDDALFRAVPMIGLLFEQAPVRLVVSGNLVGVHSA